MDGDCFFISLDVGIADFDFVHKEFLLMPNYFPSPQVVWRKQKTLGDAFLSIICLLIPLT